MSHAAARVGNRPDIGCAGDARWASDFSLRAYLRHRADSRAVALPGEPAGSSQSAGSGHFGVGGRPQPGDIAGSDRAALQRGFLSRSRRRIRGPAPNRSPGQVSRRRAAELTTPGAVVIGGYANGVSALRSLARAGVRTAVVLTKPHDIAQHSR